MDKNVNIKFNATDGGSFEKFAGKYKDLLKGMSGGGNYNTNKSYVFSEMEKELEFYNKKIQKEKELFDLKKRQMAELGNISNKAYNDYNAKNIDSKEYNRIESEVKRKEQELLKGTGRRNFNTYSKSAQSNIDALQGSLNTKAGFMDETNNLLREILNLDREEAVEKIREISKDKNATPAEKLAGELANQQIKFEKGRQPNQQSILGALINADLLISGANAARGIVTSRNGYDAFDKLGTVAADAAGGATGVAGTVVSGLLGDLGLAKSATALKASLPFLSKFVATMTGASFDVISQTVRTRQDIDQQRFRYRAATGSEGQYRDVGDYGVNFADFFVKSLESARSQGSSKNAQNNAYNSILLEKGMGIDPGTSSSLLDLMRSMSGTDKNLMNLVGGVWDKGQNIFKGDKTYLNEFMSKNFAGLEKILLTNQNEVKSGTTLDILSRFNDVGGQFKLGGQNSMGLISSINNSLVNPGSDNANAISFQILRQLHPNASFFDLMKDRQMGLNSPGYLQGMMNVAKRMGGDIGAQKYNFAQMLGLGDNLGAAEQLWNGKGNFAKNFSNGSLTSKLGNLLPAEAAKNTTSMDMFNAKQYNAWAKGFYSTMEQAGKDLAAVFKQVFESQTFTVYSADGKVKGTLSSAPVSNGIKKPADAHKPKLPPWGNITDPMKIDEWRMQHGD